MASEEQILVEKMTMEDLEKIKDILEDEFDNFWNYNILKNELQNENSAYVVAKLKDEIVGFAGITIILDVSELNNIVIKKSHRGNGISKMLLSNLICKAKEKDCKQMNLEVSEENKIAIKLYEGFNFKQVGLRKKYYNGKDAILYTLCF